MTYEVSDELLDALIQQESGGRHNAVSRAGARGITQVMPMTGRNPGFGVQPLRDNSETEYRRFGRDYLGAMLKRYNGDTAKALAAYNAGPGTVDKAGGVPNIPETQNYVKNIMGALNPISTATAEEAPNPQEWLRQHRATQGQQAQPQAAPNPQEWLRQHRATQGQPEMGSGTLGAMGNLGAGALRGAGSIGATILSPIDKAAKAMGVSNDYVGMDNRRERIDEGLKMLGANPESTAYKAGKLGTEIAGTAGVGGMLAAPLRAVAPGLAAATASSGMIANGAGIGTRMAGGALTGAASSGLVNPDDALVGGIVGAALPPGLKALGKTGAAIGAKLRGEIIKPEVKELAERAAQLGIDIPADRLVNSRPMNAIASGLNYMPLSGRAATEDLMNEQLNRAASRTMGQDSSNMTKAVRDARIALGRTINDTLKNNTVAVDNAFMDDLANIEQRAKDELGDAQFKPINNQINQILAKGETGEIDGQAAYNIKRELDRLGKGNGTEAYHARELKNSLISALNRSLGTDKAEQFGQVREQYSNMKSLAKLAKNGAEGEVSIARLGNITEIKNKPLQEVADIAAQFVKPREAQHGAMQRAVAAMTAASLGGPYGLTGVAALGWGTNKLLNSKMARNYMLNAPGAQNRLLDPIEQEIIRAMPVFISGYQ